MQRDLQIATGAAIVTIAPGAALWVLGLPAVPALLASLAVAVLAVLALGRRWYRQVIARIEAQSVHLRSTISATVDAGDMQIYWSEHAITPETLTVIRHLMDSLDLRSVLELGSGISTLLLANDFRRRGSGHIMTIDDDKRWAEQTKLRIERYKLNDFAEVRVAPLVAIDTPGRLGKWYDLSTLSEGMRFDLILVDGPPAWHGDDKVRLPALYRLRHHLSDRGVLALDDAARSGERAIAQQWQRDFPDLHFRTVRIGRGLLVASVNKAVLDLLPP